MKDFIKATIEAPFVQTEDDQEYKLIRVAAEAVHQGNWIVGECASRWWHRYRKDRTDGDFAEMIGLSEDQVFQRRRVYEEFHQLHDKMPDLTWSHFREALNWEDAEDCLQWAQDAGATVREMQAWRKAQRGELLTGSTRAPEKPAKPEGRTVHRDTTPKPKEALKPIERPVKEERPLVTAPRVVDPAVSDNSKVDEAIQQASGLIQFVVKYGSPHDRARLAGVLGPLLDGIRGSGR